MKSFGRAFCVCGSQTSEGRLGQSLSCSRAIEEFSDWFQVEGEWGGEGGEEDESRAGELKRVFESSLDANFVHRNLGGWT